MGGKGDGWVHWSGEFVDVFSLGVLLDVVLRELGVSGKEEAPRDCSREGLLLGRQKAR